MIEIQVNLIHEYLNRNETRVSIAMACLQNCDEFD